MKDKKERAVGKMPRNQNTDLTNDVYREINRVSFKQNFQTLVGNYKKVRDLDEKRPLEDENDDDLKM